MWPQIIFLGLIFLCLGFSLANDGKPRRENKMICPRCYREMRPVVIIWNEFEELRVVSDTHIFCPSCGLTFVKIGENEWREASHG